MKRQWIGGMLAFAFGTLALLACAAPAAAGDDNCFYKGTMYSEGATSCQTGKTFKCDDGKWEDTDKTCQESQPMRTSKACEFGGVSYSTGSAKCQDGTQYRCEDGEWHRLDETCPVADAPMRIVPSGKTCMYEGATVAHNSTICRSGSTFLCNDGEWTNLGTLCR